MAVDNPDAPFAFIVDTNTYAGNFERPLCAHITGQVGECGVGEKYAAVARTEIPTDVLTWFDNHVVQVPDEHNYRRPVSIWPTPGWFNHGMGGHYRDGHDPEDWAMLINQRTEVILRSDRVVPVRGDHYRELLVEIAALAIAAIASHDRKNKEA